MENGIRLDKYLIENNLVESRSKGLVLIKKGSVFINDVAIKKPSSIIRDEDNVEVRGSLKWVCRSAIKLDKALYKFKLDLSERVCMDIGASTGGFTEVLLKRGVKKVYAIDVGFGQMHKRVLEDDRVVNMEKTNAREMDVSLFPLFNKGEEKIAFICADVSFVSIIKMIETFKKYLSEDGDLVVLIKPQFEVGKLGVNKSGIVVNKELRDKAVEGVCTEFKNSGFELKRLVDSSIKGGDGNIEYIAWFKRV